MTESDTSIAPRAAAAGATLWAITSYFNPLGWRRRRENYRTFRRHLTQAPLATIEWSPDGRFELREGDADLLLQVSGGDLMWQKERLLNLLVAQLPETCRAVAWLDADIVFDRADWPAAAIEGLRHQVLLQLFSQAHHLSPGPATASVVSPGLVAAIPPNADAAAWVSKQAPVPPPAAQPARGLAWAATRDWLERFPFFDTWIVGGGDSAYCHAALGAAERVVRLHELGPAQRDDYRARAAALAKAAAGRIGFIDGAVQVLWHGDLAARGYRTRFAMAARLGFDPATFIVLTPSGVWRWTDAGAAMAAPVREYLRSRNEDG